MESTPTSTKWHQSMAVLTIATLLLPPLGLVLLWMRKDAGIAKKIFASFAILALVASYLFFAYSHGLFARRDPNMEAHYAELERQRAEQREMASSAQSTPDQPPGPTASTTANANANESKQAAPVAAAARSARSYWTNYRGPARDGRYDEAPIRTNWPAEGLPLLWKQPIGGGYASFVIAEGMAFTIEQRRRQEIVAAYDVETGREL